MGTLCLFVNNVQFEMSGKSHISSEIPLAAALMLGIGLPTLFPNCCTAFSMVSNRARDWISGEFIRIIFPCFSTCLFLHKNALQKDQMCFRLSGTGLSIFIDGVACVCAKKSSAISHDTLDLTKPPGNNGLR